MRKLKLDAIRVESFATLPAAPRGRGTVDAHIEPTPPTGPGDTYDVERCGETQYFDCSLACSYLTYCDECNLAFTLLDCV